MKDDQFLYSSMMEGKDTIFYLQDFVWLFNLGNISIFYTKLFSFHADSLTFDFYFTPGKKHIKTWLTFTDSFLLWICSLLCLSLQAEFPANTNVLYVDLQSAEKVGSSLNSTCLPGMVLNLKKPVSYVDHFGIYHRYILSNLTTFNILIVFSIRR